jgi:hypothetical protein
VALREAVQHARVHIGGARHRRRVAEAAGSGQIQTSRQAGGMIKALIRAISSGSVIRSPSMSR